MSEPAPQGGVSFTVYGTPVPQGSKRAFGRNVVEIADARLRSWRQDVTLTARQAMGALPILPGPVEIRLLFFFPRPKGHYGTGRNKDRLKRSSPAYPAVKPDLDKLARAVLDALTNVCFRDDSQVVTLSCQKLYDDQGASGLIVTLFAL
jgi:Holliday junction resolvase RusA-like endonuclease